MAIEFAAQGQVRSTLGESPVYDARRNALWYCDITERAVRRFDLGNAETRSWSFPTDVASLGLTESGRLVIALREEVGIWNPDDETWRGLCEIEKGVKETRLNDGKVGPDGAFWVGTMDDSDRTVKEPIGSLYRVTADGRVEKKVDGIVVSNGLAFAPDGRFLYHSDSRGKWIDRWDLDPATGTISNRRRLAEMEEATGRPDGGATDATGHYWSAGISAQRLNRFTPDGKLIESFPVPVAAPTMPCFAGPELATLFVTSLRAGRPQELLDRYPLTGLLIAGLSPVAGSPVGRFRDH
jgi:sugar lactone lactonase YvrE